MLTQNLPNKTRPTRITTEQTGLTGQPLFCQNWLPTVGCVPMCSERYPSCNSVRPSTAPPTTCCTFVVLHLSEFLGHVLLLLLATAQAARCSSNSPSPRPRAPRSHTCCCCSPSTAADAVQFSNGRWQEEEEEYDMWGSHVDDRGEGLQ